MTLALRFVCLVAALAALFMQGCGPRPQNIRLDPPIEVQPSRVGQGKTVWLSVKDARPAKTLGVIGDLDGQYAHVSIEDDFTSTLYQSVSAALRSMGFAVQPTPTRDERSLRIEIRDIQYQSAKKSFTYDTDVKVSVGALVQNGTERYDRIYNAGETRTSMTQPTPEDASRAVNNAVSMSLRDMLTDDRVLGVLVK